jgi:hypothetical protein
MTKQHLWPAWLGRASQLPTYLGAVANPKEFNNSGPILSWEALPAGFRPRASDYTTTVREAHPGTRTLRMVCQSCNNGWMNNVEAASKDIVTELIANTATVVTTEQQLKLAAWAAQMTIVGEFTHLSNKSITYPERAYFCEHKLPPNHWHLFVGRYQGTDYLQQYLHTAIRLSIDDGANPPIPLVGNSISANTQSSVFILGNLLLYTLSSNFSHIENVLSSFSYRGLSKIWPASGDPINLNTLPTLGDFDVDALHHFLYHIEEAAGG